MNIFKASDNVVYKEYDYVIIYIRGFNTKIIYDRIRKINNTNKYIEFYKFKYALYDTGDNSFYFYDLHNGELVSFLADIDIISFKDYIKMNLL